VIAVSIVAASCGETTDPDPPAGTPNQRPSAAFVVDVTAGAAPLDVAFDASASMDPDGSIASYAWAFGDGATGSGATTSHTYQQSGQYAPSLTVTDDRGSTSGADGDRISVNSAPGSGSNTISGVVWHDANANGQQDASEATIPEFVVFLDENGNGEWDGSEAVFFTDQDGRYRFEGLNGGQSYTVTQQLKVGWTNTMAGADPVPYPGPVVSAIIGGGVAETQEFPFQVALVTSDTEFQFCGGTFVAASWVVTAAHCVEGGVQPADIQVLAGTNDLESGGQLIDVIRIMIHPSFSANAFVDHDIALLELDGEYLYPRIELLTPDRVNLSAPGTVATVIGWGNTTINGFPSPVLKVLTAPIISNAACQTLLDDNVQPVTICAGTAGSSSSVCNGDSGGPLFVAFRDWWIQMGIVSFGANLCYQPSAFARVSALVNFVEANVPAEESGSVVVDWSGGGTTATVNFGNFR
jgi:PKD repeat protein